MLRASLCRTVVAACLAVLATAVVKSPAQVFDLDHGRKSVAPLDGLWRFHPGDDSRWADPGFDDTQWPLLRSDREWSKQGYKGLSGFSWYRFKIQIPAGSAPLSLYVPAIRTAYQVYVDGRLIGGSEKMPANVNARALSILPVLLALPESGQQARDVSVAIRVWLAPEYVERGGGPVGAPVFGDSSLLDGRAQGEVDRRLWSEESSMLVGVLECLAGLAGLAFLYFRPREREYLWFGLMMLPQAASSFSAIWFENHIHTVAIGTSVGEVLGGSFALSTIAFFARLTQARRNWLYRLALAGVCGGIAVGAVNSFAIVNVTVHNAVLLCLLLPFAFWVISVLVGAARRGVADARLLLIPILLQYSAFFIGLGIVTTYQLGWQHKWQTSDPVLSSWPFMYTLGDLSAVIFLLAMLAILIGRFTRSRREEERYAGEMEAARAVQQVLVPEPNAGLKGFSVVAEYLPAQEVGGDFYQILPTGDGGLFVVTGDVSGKGMPAAMLVALLVGAIRTEAAHTSDPAVLLQTLNSRVHGRMSDGFATCAALHISADGSAVLSNAANPAPYLNGEEIGLAGALPLGMVSEVQYDNHRLTLRAGDILTFVSDGVIEATKTETGELFGFDRSRALSQRPAAEIAAAARSFGQSDDITVLTVTRLLEVTA
jgi:sigma-B regulation protein RsbU (phosphoserine phosphatase)